MEKDDCVEIQDFSGALLIGNCLKHFEFPQLQVKFHNTS